MLRTRESGGTADWLVSIITSFCYFNEKFLFSLSSVLNLLGKEHSLDNKSNILNLRILNLVLNCGIYLLKIIILMTIITICVLCSLQTICTYHTSRTKMPAVSPLSISSLGSTQFK